MGENESKKHGLTRRDFIKGVAVVAGSEILISCSPKVASTAQPTSAANEVTAGQMNAAMASQKWSFEIPPDPIPDGEITNTVTADIIIVGAGTSGLVCANSAAENGAKEV